MKEILCDLSFPRTFEIDSPECSTAVFIFCSDNFIQFFYTEVT